MKMKLRGKVSYDEDAEEYTIESNFDITNKNGQKQKLVVTAADLEGARNIFEEKCNQYGIDFGRVVFNF